MPKQRFFPLLYAALLIAITAFNPTPSLADLQSGPFFLMGSGALHLKNLRNEREARVRLLNRDGSLNEQAFVEVDRVFGFPTEEMGEHISPRMLFMLSYFSDLVAPGKTIQIESAYRSPDYNNKIRDKGANAARTSTHIDGIALDFWIEGVNGKQLWETVREKNCCGVGHYGDKTIHLDAGRPRFWEAATSGTKAKEPDYNRHLYLSSDFDRYAQNQKIRLSLSGISTFGFGVRRTAQVFQAIDPGKPVARIPLITTGQTDCLLLNEHKDSRFLYTSLPPDLPAGRYRVKLAFCEKPFPEMPDEALSNEIEVTR
jgi:uncharacterized protein YcbK (DUF882 family)